jgi:transcriptional regulator GlxA family with amidase domain
MRIATTESKLKRPGGESVLSRMSELMFVEVLRRYISSLPDSQTGWLGGLRDRYVGAALNLLHGDPSHQWTVDELAMKVGLSRSALGERFTQLIGHSPMQYLTSWRIQTAARALANGADNIADVAARAGYGSEAAFSRAFKRVTGIAPAKYRSARRSA